MVWQAAVFLLLMVGIPMIVAWLLGGDKQAKEAKSRQRAAARAQAKAEQS